MTLSKAHLIIACTIFLCFVSHNEAKRKGERQRNKASNGNNEQGTCELEVTCRGESPLPVKLPIQGPKGDPGDRGLRGEKGPKGDQGEQGMPADWKTKIFRILGLPMPEATKVAFFVGLKNNLGSVARNEPIAFTELVTNVGGAYDVTTGYFTAPSNGTYYFNVVVAAVGREKAAVELVKNGRMVVTVWAESIPFWSTASSGVTLHLYQGDQVWLLRLQRAPFLHGFMYSSFSGFILFDD